MKKIELQLAWMWVCPSCKTKNFCESEEVDPKELEGLELPEGDLVTQPTSVLCSGCMAYFETENVEPPKA